MENRTQKSHLYGSGYPSLSWKQRLDICIGVAIGNNFHHISSPIHIDYSLRCQIAKVVDFGLSNPRTNLDKYHVTTNMKDSFGYIDLEYIRILRITNKSDVYSFRAVLCEDLCARPINDH
ncbi:Receptor-like protein kinase HERK 1 [Bienertia sinuspersici]